MSIYHDEVEIEDFEYDEDDEMYYYPCPCGDRFQITKVKIFFYKYNIFMDNV
jgi:diphthamide biosynthesis protein 3